MSEPLRPYRGPWETIFIVWAVFFGLLVLKVWVTTVYESCTGSQSRLAPATVEEAA